MSDNELAAAEKAQTQGNLRLASQFIREFLNDSEQFDMLPERATIVLLPPDEPGDAQLSFANVEMAKLLSARGRHPILWSVGQPATTGPRILTHWPVVREDQLRITYDRPHDMLTVAFSETDRPTMPVRVNPHVISQIDPETKVTISYSIPNFESAAAKRSIALIDLVVLTSTELIGTTRDEMRALRNQLVHRGAQQAREEEATLSEALSELYRLTAA